MEMLIFYVTAILLSAYETTKDKQSAGFACNLKEAICRYCKKQNMQAQ